MEGISMAAQSTKLSRGSSKRNMYFVNEPRLERVVGNDINNFVCSSHFFLLKIAYVSNFKKRSNETFGSLST